MDTLVQQLCQGIPLQWGPFFPDLSLPENVSVAQALTDGHRSVIFLRVSGHLRSAMPLFDLNTQFRSLGVEPVWLFEGTPIPSTKNMVCSAIEWVEGNAHVSIQNLDQPQSECVMIPVADLCIAALEQRLRVVGIQAGQRVSVTCTTNHFACNVCGATTSRLLAASFKLAEADRSPRLSLASHTLGLCVSRLIVDELSEQIPALTIGLEDHRSSCTSCRAAKWRFGQDVMPESKATGSIVLSSVAALELLRHYKTAWYIA